MLTNLILSFLTVLATGFAPVPQDPKPVARPAFDIADFAWLAGQWRGEGLGGSCEEIWSRPMAGTMVGTFRLVKNGEIVFYEIMVLGGDAKGGYLKVKHFSKNFVAWEDKAECVRFALESVRKDRAVFSGLTLERRGDKLDIKLKMRSGDGSTRWETFAFQRQKPDAKK